jgi:hypothetical protein
MIRLNLLANLSRERMSRAALVRVFVGVALVAAMVVAAVMYLSPSSAPAPRAIAPATPLVTPPPAAAASPVAAPATPTTPATAAPVVAAPLAAPPGTAAPANLSYASMRIEQRICYEMLFTKRVFDLLSAAVPSAVKTLDSLALDSFAVLHVAGSAGTKEQVVALLAALKQPGVTLRPRPQTRVSGGEGGLQFCIAADASFGLPPGDPFVDSAIVRLPTPDLHTAQVRQFQQLAAGNNVNLRHGLSLVSRQKAGAYRRYTYRMDATTAGYQELSRFVAALYAGRVLCAMGNLRLAGSAGRATLSAEVYFMARE